MGFVEGFREIHKSGGYIGFYKGFHFALMRAVPMHATAFMTMEICKNNFWAMWFISILKNNQNLTNIINLFKTACYLNFVLFYYI